MKEKFDYTFLIQKVEERYRGKDFVDKSASMCNRAKVKIFSLREAMKDKYYFNTQEVYRMKNEMELTDEETIKMFYTIKKEEP